VGSRGSKVTQRKAIEGGFTRMSSSKTVRLPQLAWYGDSELEIDFPDSWDVRVCRMHGHDASPLREDGIRKGLRNPIGTRTIKELAKGKKEIVILFDDMTRATPTAVMIPYVLEELAAAGIPDRNIRFIAAIGAHGAMNGIDFRKKLGDEVMSRFLVYNHNPYENCTPLGPSRRGIPIQINSEVMSCDFKVGVGSIVPHPFSGFGGGSKIILPGVASITTIDLNHTRLFPSPSTGIGKYEGNILKQDMDEAARMAGLDIKVDAILNLKREITALFVGDPIEEHIEGVKLARGHYATDMLTDCDIVVANCYSKANEMLLAPAVASPLLPQKGGDMVLMVVTPEGQINHYWSRSFGKNFGGRAFLPKTGLPPNTKRLIVMALYPDKVGADWLAPYGMVNWARSWSEVLEMLRTTYGDRAKVAVIPDATIQYFPDAPQIWRPKK
jgi:nickel-dependent lactate racemase